MNRRLLDPFQSVELPEVIEEYLEHGSAFCMSFNRRGTLLAAGTKEGHVVIWDFDTRGVAAVLLGHSATVTSVAWSRSGRNLLSGSEDQSIILWDLISCSKVCRVGLRSAVLRVSLSPRPPHLAVVSLTEGPPVLVDLTSQQTEPLPQTGDGAEPVPVRGYGAGAAGAAAGGMIAILNRQGDMIIGSQLRGALSVVDVATRKIIDVVRLPNSARVVDLELNRKGTLLLATCTDQRVRMYEVASRASLADADVPSEAQVVEALANRSAVKSGSLLHGEAGLLRPVRDFQNAVERTPWRSATFSCDSEHVVGVTAAKAQLHIYIWNRPLGNMERMLEGPKESGLDLVWHPLRSLLLSCASSGRIYIWAKVHAENWSAFAPDFKELDENTEYVEREDEFDWNTPGAGGELGLPSAAGGGEGHGEADPPGSVVLDVVTREPQPVFSSDDEEGGAQELLYLPVVVEPELPAGAAAEEGAAGGERQGGGGGGGGAPSPGDDPAVAQQALMLQMGRLAQFPRRSGSAGAGRNGQGQGPGPGSAAGPGAGEPRRGGGGGRGARRGALGDGGDAVTVGVKREHGSWERPVAGQGLGLGQQVGVRVQHGYDPQQGQGLADMAGPPQYHDSEAHARQQQQRQYQQQQQQYYQHHQQQEYMQQQQQQDAGAPAPATAPDAGAATLPPRLPG